MVGLGKNVAQAIETPLPGVSTLGDPLLGRAQRRRRHGEGANASDLFGADEAAGLEDLKVLDDRGEGHRQGSRQVAGGGRPAAQAVDQVAPGWVGEGLEEAVEGGRRGRRTQVIAIVKQLLEYVKPSARAAKTKEPGASRGGSGSVAGGTDWYVPP